MRKQIGKTLKAPRSGCGHTVSSILAKLSDAGLIVAANAYTDGEGGRHWREVEPLPKGAAGRERTDKAAHSCTVKAKSNGTDTTKNTEPTKTERSCTDTANRTGSAKAESSSPANASRGCPAKASAHTLRKDDAASFCLSACTQTETLKAPRSGCGLCPDGAEKLRLAARKPRGDAFLGGLRGGVRYRWGERGDRLSSPVVLGTQREGYT